MERFRQLRRQMTGSEATTAAATAVQPPNGPADSTPERARDVHVIYGASVQALALAGLTVAQVRPVVETILAVGPRSPALVNGRPVRENYVLAESDALEFVHHAGEKGRVRWSCGSRSREIKSFVVRME
jgi:hypothetical protein